MLPIKTVNDEEEPGWLDYRNVTDLPTDILTIYGQTNSHKEKKMNSRGVYACLDSEATHRLTQICQLVCRLIDRFCRYIAGLEIADV